MATFPLTKANCDVPGTDPYTYFWYGLHNHEHLRVWRPTGWDSAGFKNAGCLIHFHGGLGHNPGNGGINLTATGNWLQTLHETYGYVIVSVEYPPVANTSDPKAEHASCRLWPAHVFSCARAYSLVAGSAQGGQYAEALFGRDGAGELNTISLKRTGVYGFSYGGTISLLLGLIPTPILSTRETLALSRTPWEYAAPITPAFCIHEQAQIDWTQFAMSPSQTIGTYRDNRHQVFAFYEDGVEWGTQYGGSPGTTIEPAQRVPEHWKRAASPWWWAAEGYVEARQTAFVGLGKKAQSTDPDQANLLWTDFEPGTPRIAEDQGKAWYDPHLNFGVKPLHDLMSELGLKNTALWGNASTNPGGNNLDDHDLDDFVINYLTVQLGL